jgi:hypothetical protein
MIQLGYWGELLSHYETYLQATNLSNFMLINSRFHFGIW